MKIEYRVEAPIAFLVFNRPDTTERVFAEIARVKPRKLLVVADGPRPNRKAESEKCAAVRSVIEKVDWDCEVLKNYSEVNLGCKRRVSSGIDWVFNTVDRAIILEDDIVPHLTFFRFCDELLEKYAEDNRVGAICGGNFQDGRRRDQYSYYFSRYTHVWGWATWARAWQHYDVGMELWQVARREGYLRAMIRDDQTLDYWTSAFQAVYEGNIDTWDYQWVFACWLNSMVVALPQVNLVSNIGFGAGATHTTDPFSKEAEKPTSSIHFPLVHPPFVVRHESADEYTDEQQFCLPGRKNVSHPGCPLCNLRRRFCSTQTWLKIKRVGHLVKKRKFRLIFGKIKERLCS